MCDPVIELAADWQWVLNSADGNVIDIYFFRDNKNHFIFPGNLIAIFEMFRWKHTHFISIGFQFNNVDGTGYYGGSCGGFSGGTQMAGSAPHPDNAQEKQQQQQEMPTSLAAQQQLVQIGEQQSSSYNLCCPVENAVLWRFMLHLH